MQYILEFIFFQHRVDVLFPVQFTMKTTPKKLYVSTLSTASPLMYTGLVHLWFFLKSMHTSLVLETFKYK